MGKGQRLTPPPPSAAPAAPPRAPRRARSFLDDAIAVLCPPGPGRVDYRGPTARTYFASSLVHLIDLIGGEERPLVLIHGEALTESDLELASRIPDLPGRPILALLALEGGIEKAVVAARRLEVGMVLPDDCLLHAGELERWIDWFDRGGPSAGLREHLGAQAEIRRFPIRGPRDKTGATAEILDLARNLRPESSFQFDLRLILEELLNNAFYHAFIDAAGDPRYAIETFEELGASDEVWVEFGRDDRTIALAVGDNRGVLTRDRTLAKIERQLSVRGLLDESGRGLYLTWSLAGRVVFNLRRGKLTETTALFPLHPQGWRDVSAGRPVLIYERG